MYMIYYIYDNRMDMMKCNLKELLPYYLRALNERGAKIICIKDDNGELIEG